MSMRSDVQTIDPLTKAADIAKLLSDPTRLRILQALFGAQEDMCVYEIAEKVGSSQSATSHQLAKLEAYGVVICYREGQKMCYELSQSPLVADIKKALSLFNVL